MESKIKRPNQKDDPPQKHTWTELLEIFNNNKDKIGWILTVLSALFIAGFFSGRYYEDLMGRFTIADLKRQHSEEIQKLNKEKIEKDLEEMKKTEQLINNKILKAKIQEDEK